MGPYACVRACACWLRVSVCCPAAVVQPTRVRRYGEQLPRSASQQQQQQLESSDEQRAETERRTIHRESAKAHRHTGIMEKRAALRRTLPSNGLRLLTSLLTLYGLTCELTALFVIALLLRLLREVAVEALRRYSPI